MRVQTKLMTLDTNNAASTCTSIGYDVSQSLNIAIQAVLTGSPVGSLAIQASLDEGHINAANEATRDDDVVNWSTVSTTAISAASTVIVNVPNEAYTFVRLVYTPTSGSGSISARLATKTL
jgi:hypothetical protein